LALREKKWVNGGAECRNRPSSSPKTIMFPTIQGWPPLCQVDREELCLPDGIGISFLLSPAFVGSGSLAMTYKINPAFDRFPVEAKLVGLILSSFGELELTICGCAQAALQANDSSILKTLYRLRATSSRIDVADGLMRLAYIEHGLIDRYDEALKMLKHCLTIRNQFAHCNWADHDYAGLFFADLQSSAKNKEFSHSYRHVDPPLLNSQFDFFKLTLQWLRFLDHEMAVKQGRLSAHVWPEPPSSTLPPLHNLASQHVPPWLGQELQEAHSRRALEAESLGQPLARPPSVLRLTREEWAAKDAKDAREQAKEPE
jgi:hypothetical protein